MDMPIILRPVPEMIETERLLLSAVKGGQGEQVYSAVVESLAELRAYPAFMAWALSEPSWAQSESFCRGAEASFIARRDFSYALSERTGGRVLGCIGLHRLRWDVPVAEIGYWRRPSAAGAGIVAEAVRALAQTAISSLGMIRLEIETDARNVASRLTAERAGFTLECVRRRDRRAPDGGLVDTAVYVRLAEAAG